MVTPSRCLGTNNTAQRYRRRRTWARVHSGSRPVEQERDVRNCELLAAAVWRVGVHGLRTTGAHRPGVCAHSEPAACARTVTLTRIAKLSGPAAWAMLRAVLLADAGGLDWGALR